MDILKECPECKSELEEDHNGLQLCSVCDYWTRNGTARIDSIMIFA